MKEMAKRTAVAALAGVITVGMLAGCGEQKLDGTKTVATVDGTEIPLGVVSLMVRQQQAQTEAMYQSFMGGGDMAVWDTEAEEGKTYGEQAVEQTMEQIELMYILKEKAEEYGVEVTKEDEEAMEEAAAAFMEANTEETIEELSVTEDQVKAYLELRTYEERMHEPIVADVDMEISDEEAQQSAFTYVSVSTGGDELTEDDRKEKKEQAQEILDKMKEDPTADMSETAKAVDDSYNALKGTFTTHENEDEEGTASSYPDEVLAALRKLKEGEVASELTETDNGYYILRLDQEFDEEATESRKDSILETRKSDLYTEVTEKWLEEADIKVEDKVLKTLKVTDNHSFNIQIPETEAEEDVEAADDGPEIEEEAEEALTEEEIDAEADITAEEASEEEDAVTEESASEDGAETAAEEKGTEAGAEVTPAKDAESTPAKDAD